ncbi:MAG TPA: site-2 protease family protein [Acidimicrobiales bacterium]|nr:site-2 protease family protein [Acidimicrobiales bacterium]
MSGASAANRRALARLALGVALVVALALALHGLAVLVVVLALVVMVMAHEAGHLVTAKLSGMKVTEYFLGFGPRLWSVRRGETDYGVKAIPAGGYVRIVGMTSLERIDPADEPRSYRQASFPRRILVASAGSATHFVLAFLLLWGMVAFSGVPRSTGRPVVSAMIPLAHGRSPASRAGLEPGDVIVAADGRRVGDAAFVRLIRSHPGTPVRLEVQRGARRFSVWVTPVDGRRVELPTASGPEPAVPAARRPTGFIGVELGVETRDETANPLVALWRAGSMLGSVTRQTATGIAQVFSPSGLRSFAHHVATAASPPPSGEAGSQSQGGQILSIVGAVQIGAQAAQRDVSELLYILVAINIFVALVNLFPMLPLDGGHVAIACYERLRSRRGRRYHADVAKLMPAAYLFLAGMVVLGLSALYANIVQPPTLGGG